ncbi:MAG: hypothetical protein KA743_08660, partial [Geothrix sp.]|nr:hypothetical protein [Geothrix sp.]
LEVSGYRNHSIYSLSSKGKKQLVEVYCIESDIEQALTCLRERLLRDQGTPGVNRGRLESAGLRVHGNQLVFVKHGRAVESSPLLKSLGIDSTTETSPDYDWWRRLWDERHSLPQALAEGLITPDEIARRWPWLGRHKDELPAGKRNEEVMKPEEGVISAPTPEPRLALQRTREPHSGMEPGRARSI